MHTTTDHTKPQRLQRVQIKSLCNPRTILYVLGFLFVMLLVPISAQARDFGNLIIDEINYSGYAAWEDMASPTSYDQYIRIRNTTGVPIDITGYSMRIVSGATDKEIVLGGILDDILYVRRIRQSQGGQPSLALTFQTNDFGNLSNTDGGFIEMRNSSGSTVDSVNMYGGWWENASRGFSLHRQGNTWISELHSWGEKATGEEALEDSEDTPLVSGDDEENESENVSDGDKESNTLLSIDQVYQLSHNDPVYFEGTVVIPQDRVYASSIYLGSDNRLVRVQYPREMEVSLNEGKSIRIRGTWFISDTQEYIRLESIEEVTDSTPFTPTFIEQDSIESLSPGGLYQVRGVVGVQQSQSVSLMNGENTIQIRFPNVFDKRSFRRFDEMVVQGFLDRRGDIWRLTPWSQQHIQVVPMIMSEPVQDETPIPSDSTTKVLQSLKQVYSQQSGRTVRLRGRVIAIPDSIYAHSLYITDGVHSVRVVLPRNDTRKFSIGQTFEVVGEWFRSATQEYVKLSEINSIPQTFSTIQAMKLDTVSEEAVGKVVQISGTLNLNQGQNLTIITQNGEVRVRLPKNIQKPVMRKGDSMEIKGFVDRRNDIFRVQVWDPEDVIVFASNTAFEDNATENSENKSTYLAIQDSSEFATLNHRQEVEVIGTVVITSGMVYTNALYILVDTRLIRVNHPRDANPNLKYGQEVILRGTWHSTETRQYLRLEETNVLGEGLISLSPLKKTILGVDSWGEMVIIQGQVELNQSTKLIVNTAGGSQEVRLPSGFVRPEGLRKGDVVRVIGFVDIYQGRARITPWMPDQVVIIPQTSTIDAENIEELLDTPTLPGESQYVPWEEYQLNLQTGIRPETVERFFEPLWNRLPLWVRQSPEFLIVLSLNIIWIVWLLLHKVRKMVQS